MKQIMNDGHLVLRVCMLREFLGLQQCILLYIDFYLQLISLGHAGSSFECIWCESGLTN